MHEAGLMQTALDLACDRARQAGGVAVRRLVLRVGADAGVEPDALRFAFEALAPGTPAGAAVLDIEVVPARTRCPGCDRGFEPDGPLLACPACGVIAGGLSSGQELELVRIEVSVP